MHEEILEKISSSGLKGIKRTELKKQFGASCEDVLKRLSEKNKIILEKKGNSYIAWTTEYHRKLEKEKKSKFDKKQSKQVSTSRVIPSSNIGNETQIGITSQNSDTDFKFEFDKCLDESGMSIGWTQFSQIRKKICDSRNITSEHFYYMASDLIEKNRENYEISSGGKEGIVLRGLIHGFVRNI